MNCLRQQLDERVSEVRKLVLIYTSVRPEAIGHTRRHELYSRALERGPRRRHLLCNNMAIAPLRDHALDRLHLALDSAQATKYLGNHVIGEIQLPAGDGAPGFTVRTGLALRRHAKHYTAWLGALQYPTGYGILSIAALQSAKTRERNR